MMRLRDEGQTGTEPMFEAMENMPSQAFYFLTLGAVAASAVLFLTGRRAMGLFVGQWPPTIMAATLFVKLLRPSHERPLRDMQRNRNSG